MKERTFSHFYYAVRFIEIGIFACLDAFFENNELKTNLQWQTIHCIEKVSQQTHSIHTTRVAATESIEISLGIDTDSRLDTR